MVLLKKYNCIFEHTLYLKPTQVVWRCFYKGCLLASAHTHGTLVILSRLILNCQQIESVGVMSSLTFMNNKLSDCLTKTLIMLACQFNQMNVLQNPLFISLLQLLIYFITLSLLAYANALSILPGAIHASGKPNKHDGSLNTNNGV